MRRIPYNFIVGSVGIVTLMIALLSYVIIDTHAPGELVLSEPPFFIVFWIVLYVIMANICYTFGWIIEMAVQYVFPEYSDDFASLTFFWGIVLSICIMLFPAVSCIAAALYAVFGNL